MQSNFFPLNSPSSSSSAAAAAAAAAAAQQHLQQQQQQGFMHQQQFSQTQGVLPSPTAGAQFMPPSFPQMGMSQPFPSPSGMGMQRFPFVPPPSTLQHIPHRPPMLFTGIQGSPDMRFSPSSHDPTLRALQGRVTQVAAMARAPPPPPSLQDLAMFTAQHITPRNGPDATRSHLQELTHLNPRGAARVQPQFANMKMPAIPSPLGTAVRRLPTPTAQVVAPPMPEAMFPFQVPKQTQEDVQKLLQFASQNKALKDKQLRSRSVGSTSVSPSSSKRSARTDEDEEFAEDEIPELEDPEGKKSIEEWKRFRLRVMSRLRKQRWRAKKKAEVLAGVEHTRLEEEERLRRDRIRKQQQRAKKRQRMLEEQQTSAGAGGVTPSSHHSHSSVATESPSASTGSSEEEHEEMQTVEVKPSSSSSSAVPVESPQPSSAASEPELKPEETKGAEFTNSA